MQRSLGQQSQEFDWLAVCCICFLHQGHLVGLAVKASASRAEGPGFKSHLRQDFFRVESYQ